MPSILIDIAANMAKLQSGLNEANSNIKSFADKSQSSFQSFTKSWAVMTTGINQGIQLFRQVAAAAEVPIKAYMEQENALMKMGIAMANQGDYSRKALKELNSFSEQVQKSTVYGDEFTLSMMANLKSYGMTNEEVKKATKVALDFASAKKTEGMTATTAGELIGKAYAGNTSTLSRYGVVIDSTLKGADRFNAVMEQLQGRFGGAAQAEIMTYAGQWQQLKNQWGDIQEIIGLGLLKSIQGLQVGAGLLATTFLTAGNAILGMLRLISTPLFKLLEGVAWLADKAGLSGLADGLRSVTSSIDQAQASIVAAREDTLKWTSSQYDNLKATDQVTTAIEKMGIVGKRTTEVVKAGADTQKKAFESAKAIAAEIEKEDQRRFDKTVKQINDEYDIYVKAEKDKADWHERMAEEEVKDTIKAINDEYDYYLKAENKKEDLAKDRVKMERDVYKDIRGFATESYSATISLIESQADAYRKAGVSAVAITAWVAQETIKAEIAKGKASDKFFEGVAAGFLELDRKQTKWGEVGVATVETFAKESEKQMSNNFFKILKGNFGQVTLDWDTMWDTMLKTVSDYLARIATEAAMSAAWKYGSAAVATGWDWLSTVLGYAEGAWQVKKEQLAVLHPGELVMPAAQAKIFREISEAGVAPGSSDPTAAQASPSYGGWPDYFSTKYDFGKSLTSGAIGGLAGYAALALSIGASLSPMGAFTSIGMGAMRGFQKGMLGFFAGLAGFTQKGRLERINYDYLQGIALAAGNQEMIDALGTFADYGRNLETYGAITSPRDFYDSYGNYFSPGTFGIDKSLDSGGYDSGYDGDPGVEFGGYDDDFGADFSGYAAKGGIIDHASLVMAGEAGPEAIMPLVRGGNGKLGVSASGGDSETRLLREDLRTVNFRLLKLIDDFGTIIKRWDGQGLPDTRILV